MRALNVLAALSAGMSLAILPVWANDSFTDRCIALKARLANLDCRQMFREAHTILSDGGPYVSSVAQELKRNRGRLSALSDVLKETTRAAQNCLAKHVKEAPAVVPAYLSIDQFHVDLERWVTHKWEFPDDFARKYQQNLIDKYNKALEAIRSVNEQL